MVGRVDRKTGAWRTLAEEGDWRSLRRVSGLRRAVSRSSASRCTRTSCTSRGSTDTSNLEETARLFLVGPALQRVL